MKAALVLALAGAAAATNCAIPAPYAVANGNACGGAATGYLIYGFCTTGVNPTQFTPPPLADTVVPLTNTNFPSFTSAGGATAVGCTVPASGGSWGMAATLTAAPLVNTAACTGTGTTLISTADNILGVEIQCDREKGYYPSRGFEGAAVCAAAAGASIFGAANIPAPVDYWYSAGYMFNPKHTIPTETGVDHGTAFTGANALVCSKACVLPPNLCTTTNGLAGNIVGSGNAFNLATCTMPPSNPGVLDSTFTFMCAVAGRLSPPFTITCDGTADGQPNLHGYTNQCGAPSGAQTTPLFGSDVSRLLRGSQTLGEIRNYPSVTSTIRTAYTAGSFVQARYWNNNGAQSLQAGSVLDISIDGCDHLVGPPLTQCVQQTLNYWRCKHDIDFVGAVCYANYAVIACPTHELGFRCPGGSKKGLFGLFGLLGIIPLVLLCCCLLALCCLRRKKTEGDVHFATFDPHAPICGAPSLVPSISFAGGCQAPTLTGVQVQGYNGATPFGVPGAF